MDILLVLGPSNSGKTVITRALIENADTIFSTLPDEIIYCYGAYQKGFEDMSKVTRFHEGLIDLADIPQDNRPRVLILDDISDEAGNSQDVANLFVKFSHHRNITVILITQNVFSKGKFFRTLSLNAQYLFLTRNIRDVTQVYTLARQIFPRNSAYMMEAYNHAMKSQKFGHLLVDLRVDSEDKNRLLANIFSEPVLYRP